MAVTEARMSQLEAKVEQHLEAIADLRGLIVSLDQKFTKMFLAVIGIQITTLLAIVGGLFTMVSKLLPQ